MFLSILGKKTLLCGGTFVTVDTKAYKASQYDHAADSYEKVPLSQRSKVIGGHKVQRDLYSAFLLRNSNDTYDCPDRMRCTDSFETLRGLPVKSHKREILKNAAISIPIRVGDAVDPGKLYRNLI